MAFLISALVWALLGIVVVRWLFSKDGGWESVKTLPFRQRMRILFSNIEVEKIEEDNIKDNVKKFVKRFRIVYYLYIIIPLVVYYGLVFYVYAR